MVETKEIGAGAVGVGVGIGQTFLLRKYADGTPLIPQLGNWGQPSALVGMGVGGVAALIGLSGYFGKGPLKYKKPVAVGVAGYGITALSGGLYSGWKPVTPMRAPQRVPMQRVPAMAPPVRQPLAQVPLGNQIRVVEQGRGLVIRSLGQ